VPRLDLPSGAWIDYRDTLGIADRWAVQGSYTVTVEDGKSVIPGNVGELQQKAFLSRIITAWSFEGIPIPSQNIGGGDVLDTVFSDEGKYGTFEDFDFLDEKLRPLFEKASPPNRQARKKASTSNA
jgi:hypothetical protein